MSNRLCLLSFCWYKYNTNAKVRIRRKIDNWDGMIPLFYKYCNFNDMTTIIRKTFMLPNSVIHQPNFWIERKNDGHLHFSNVYLWRHSADLSQRFFRTDHPDTDAQFICSDVKVTQGSHDIDCGCNTKNMQRQMIDMSTQIVKYLTQTISNKCMVQEGRRYRLFEVSNVKDEYLRC